eukprot:TRINITY_DN2647_c0_g2_i1.p2 TRINITY_DN2647_c0_g2~~TRINITY_DN2647_c0_g2_i1.p2  ORF type:complete len:380 (+),score=135.99 TRINITY_DN2647_c0_g2_i1:741-1880(+)
MPRCHRLLYGRTSLCHFLREAATSAAATTGLCGPAVPLECDTPEVSEPTAASAPSTAAAAGSGSIATSLALSRSGRLFESRHIRELIEQEREAARTRTAAQRAESEALVQALLREERRLAAMETARMADDARVARELAALDEREAEAARAHREREDEAAARRAQLLYGLTVEAIECVVCTDEAAAGEGVALQCGHAMCTECFEQYVRGAIEARETLGCAYGDCAEQVSARDVRVVLGDAAANMYASIEQLALRRDLDGLVHCKTPDCPNSVMMGDKARAKHPKWRCTECNCDWCVVCDDAWHEGSTCEQFQAWRAENGAVDRAFDELIEQGVVRVCVCGKPIIKNGGCPQITCKCGVKFCWKCETVLKKGEKCAHVKYH